MAFGDVATGSMKAQDGLHLDLKSPQDRAKLANPELFLGQYTDRLVILDEIHRVPEIFQPLRGIIDKGRRSHQPPGTRRTPTAPVSRRAGQESRHYGHQNLPKNSFCLPWRVVASI
jgi:hypothetical protein